MLEGPGICHHFFLGNFLNIPTWIYQFGQQHKPVSTEAWQCGRSLEVGLLHSQFLHLLWKPEGGPHLPGKLSVIFHSWYCQQLRPPVWGFTLLHLSWYPLTKTPRLEALEASNCLHLQRSLATLSGMMPPPAQVLVASPDQSLCQWLLPQTLSLGQWGGWGQGVLKLHLVVSPLLYSAPSSPYSWISPLLLGGSKCDLTFLSLLWG